MNMTNYLSDKIATRCDYQQHKLQFSQRLSDLAIKTEIGNPPLRWKISEPFSLEDGMFAWKKCCYKVFDYIWQNLKKESKISHTKWQLFNK